MPASAYLSHGEHVWHLVVVVDDTERVWHQTAVRLGEGRVANTWTASSLHNHCGCDVMTKKV